MFPLTDPDIQRHTRPYVTIALVTLNVVVFLYEYELLMGSSGQTVFFYRFGLIPAELAHGANYTRLVLGSGQTVDIASPVPNWATIFTSMFIHEGYLHIIGNMVFLWVLGNSVEDRVGRIKYLLLYFASGVVGALAQVAVDTGSKVPTIGASGAIAGVVGAYFMLFPYSRINTRVFFFIIAVVRIPAVVLLGLWITLQFFSGIGSLGAAQSGGVAYWAHLGGFAVGVGAIVFARLVRREPMWQSRRPPRHLPPQDFW